MNVESTSGFLGNHPVLGTILSWLLIIIAEVAEVAQVPLIVMQVFQLIVWGLAISISVTTLIGLYKKNFRKDKPE